MATNKVQNIKNEKEESADFEDKIQEKNNKSSSILIQQKDLNTLEDESQINNTE